MKVKQVERLPTEISAAIYAAGHDVREAVARVRTMVDGQEVYILRNGRYKNRRGTITAVVPDERLGMRFLVMVHDRRNERFLNSDVESRTFRAPSEFAFTGQLSGVRGV